ncbi:MAG: winged-helix domain-containing protein [Actinomycetota bacterium]
MHKSPKKLASAESLHRLALYHCLLTDFLLCGKKITTSKEIADELDLNESTVRRDLSLTGNAPGKRGIGYDASSLRQRISDFLALPPFAPFAMVGSVAVTNAVFNFFPIEKFGFMPIAFFSEEPGDWGKVLNGHEVKPVDDISPALATMGINVAMVACRPNWVQHSINLLAQAGIKSILILTQSTLPSAPQGVHLAHVRIACELKSLFYFADSKF